MAEQPQTMSVGLPQGIDYLRHEEDRGNSIFGERKITGPPGLMLSFATHLLAEAIAAVASRG